MCYGYHFRSTLAVSPQEHSRRCGRADEGRASVDSAVPARLPGIEGRGAPPLPRARGRRPGRAGGRAPGGARASTWTRRARVVGRAAPRSRGARHARSRGRGSARPRGGRAGGHAGGRGGGGRSPQECGALAGESFPEHLARAGAQRKEAPRGGGAAAARAGASPNFSFGVRGEFASQSGAAAAGEEKGRKEGTRRGNRARGRGAARAVRPQPEPRERARAPRAPVSGGPSRRAAGPRSRARGGGCGAAAQPPALSARPAPRPLLPPPRPVEPGRPGGARARRVRQEPWIPGRPRRSQPPRARGRRPHRAPRARARRPRLGSPRPRGPRRLRRPPPPATRSCTSGGTRRPTWRRSSTPS